MDHFLPGIGVDHATRGATAHLGADLTTSTRQANCSPNTCRLNGGYIASTNGGTTWRAPIQIPGPIKLNVAAEHHPGLHGGRLHLHVVRVEREAYPVIATATGNSCVLGNITSCHEPMVAPTNGLAAVGGSNLATTGPVRYLSTSRPTRMLTAF